MDMVETRHFTALRGALKLDEPMARHVSWRAGGIAQRAYWPADIDDLVAFLKTLRADEPIYFVGLGSNLLVRDGGLRGTVVFPHGRLNHINIEIRSDGSRFVLAEAGVASPKVARFAARHGMAGAEFFAGVPGTVGGALAMNAGCYGSETWEFVENVMTVDRHGQLRERVARDYEIDYRHVVLRQHRVPNPESRNEEWFLSARFHFPDGDQEIAKARIKDWLTRRIATQPLDWPNAGSTFRNPPGDHAARLIESCGLKGFTIGDAQVSEKHANFIINLGHASAADIEALINHVHETVLANTGIDLVQEVRIVGEGK
jgi:UDP-N-acetylmuramate dehydrogenase